MNFVSMFDVENKFGDNVACRGAVRASHLPSFLALFVTLVAATRSASAADGLLAYEEFDYAAGVSIAGQSGGSGWSNAWVDVSGNVGETVNSGSLSANGNGPFAYD